MWTLDELVERVREALAAEYPGAPNGRVRDLPDRRGIRWYTTIGLVDKPLGMRGRTALYGPRHLEQLVAIKRMQANGRSLSEIQVDFAWLTAPGLSEIARVPEELLGEPGFHNVDQPAEAERSRFWADRPAERTPEPEPAALPRSAAPALPAVPASSSPRPPAGAPPPTLTSPAAARPVSGVTLGGGVVLLIPHETTERDRADIAAAAAPLIDLLQARGLTDGSSS